MITKSRFVLALTLVLALGVSGLAFGDGVSENEALVDGAVGKTKLPDSKKKAKKVTLFLGVRNVQTVTGSQSNPASEEISVDKKIDVSAIGDHAQCPSLPANGSTPEQAKASCPEDAFLGSGEAEVTFPPPPSGIGPVSDVVVSVFHGPAGAQPPAGRKAKLSIPVILHTYSPTLRTASPSVQAYIVGSRAGNKYGSTLWVPNSPETGSGLITKFNALLGKDVGVTAYCKAPGGGGNKAQAKKSGKFAFLRKVTYKDGSSETAQLKQKCKPKSTN